MAHRTTPLDSPLIRSGALLTTCLAGLLLSTQNPARATVVRALSLAEKIQVAPVIVHGVVERAEPSWEIPNARVKTEITVQVVNALKGGHNRGERIVLRRAGGKIGNFSHQIPGLSRYVPGEEVILFLEPLSSEFVSIGIGIGKYDVRGTGQNRVVYHSPNVAGVPSGENPGAPVRVGAARPEPLDQFLAKVREIAGARAYSKKNTGADLQSPATPGEPATLPEKGAEQ